MRSQLRSVQDYTRRMFCFVFFTPSHLVFTWWHRTGAPKTNVLRDASRASPTAGDDGGRLQSCAPDSIDSIKTLTRHSTAVIRDAVWIQPPSLSCRALQRINTVRQCFCCSPLRRRIIAPADDQPERHYLFLLLFRSLLSKRGPKWWIRCLRLNEPINNASNKRLALDSEIQVTPWN